MSMGRHFTYELEAGDEATNSSDLSGQNHFKCVYTSLSIVMLHLGINRECVLLLFSFLRPLFLRFKFATHEECWDAFHVMQESGSIGSPLVLNPNRPANSQENMVVAEKPWNLCWLRTHNYWEMSVRARRSLEGIDFQKREIRGNFPVRGDDYSDTLGEVPDRRSKHEL